MKFSVNFEDFSEKTREMLAEETKDPELLDYLSKDESKIVLYAVAKNIYTKQEVLDKFSRLENSKLKESTAENVKIGISIIDRLSKDRNVNVKSTVAATKYEQPHRDVLIRLAKDKTPEVRVSLVRPSGGREKIKNDEEILRILLDSSPEEKLPFSYNSEPSTKNQYIRGIIAEVTKDQAKLEELSKDFGWITRFNVVKNSATPIELVEKMKIQLEKEIEGYRNKNPEEWKRHSGLFGSLSLDLSYLHKAINDRLKKGYVTNDFYWGE